MDRFWIPTEEDFRQWIKNALKEYFEEQPTLPTQPQSSEEEGFLNRKQVADLLSISLVTLHDWMNRGLPCHKQRGRVYFVRSEVIEYVKEKRPKTLIKEFPPRKSHLRPANNRSVT